VDLNLGVLFPFLSKKYNIVPLMIPEVCINVVHYLLGPLFPLFFFVEGKLIMVQVNRPTRSTSTAAPHDY
jgi:hypothetical protein